MWRLFSILAMTLLLSVLSGCGPTQISSIRDYKGSLSTMSESCQVVWTSINYVFAAAVDDGKTNILGESKVSTRALFEEEEVAHDCMVLGAKSAVVLDQREAPKAADFGITVGSVTLLGNRSAPDYLVIYFDKELSVKGRHITMADYLTWARNKKIRNCKGCEPVDSRHPTCHER
ncbi:MAG: hypothetical protein MJZ05_13460 [Fibrobacter sp.]|nr:hypothetical protein [Fibrobacter sp.]